MEMNCIENDHYIQHEKRDISIDKNKQNVLKKVLQILKNL